MHACRLIVTAWKMKRMATARLSFCYGAMAELYYPVCQLRYEHGLTILCGSSAPQSNYHLKVLSGQIGAGEFVGGHVAVQLRSDGPC